MLIRGGEVELAYALSQLARVENVDVAAKHLALRCEALGMIDEAIALLQDTKDSRVEVCGPRVATACDSASASTFY